MKAENVLEQQGYFQLFQIQVCKVLRKAASVARHARELRKTQQDTKWQCRSKKASLDSGAELDPFFSGM